MIGASYVVFRAFGYGFLESVYRRAMAVELRFLGVNVAQEVPYKLSIATSASVSSRQIS